MQTDENHYKHILAQGLPRSLTQGESGTVAVIALMQRQAGLNRERKREMQSGAKSPGQIDEALSEGISKTDRNILSFYLSGRERWGSFWSVVRKSLRQQNATGTMAYAIAVDVQLLNAYHPEWTKLSLEVGLLTEVCSEWEHIRERLERFWKPGGKEQMPLDVFMLWPRVITDLKRWGALDVDRQIQVGHAVFSLSSIGATRWFIDEAVSICPDLESELGALTASVPRRVQLESGLEEDQSSLGDQPRVNEVKANSAFDIASAWEMLGEDLTQLQNEWKPTPTHTLLGRLITFGNDAAQLLAAMPDYSAPPKGLLEQRLRALRHCLHEAASLDELRWLSADDQNSIMARWDLALITMHDDGSVLQLADDAELAKDRLAAAIGEMQIAQEEVDRKKQVVMALDEELTRLVSGIRRVDLTNQQLQAKEDVLAAERKQNDVVLQVFASASPRGEVFDPKIDYAAEAAAQLQGELYP